MFMHGVSYLIFLFFILVNLNTIFAERHLSSFNFHFQYTGDFVENFSGGIDRGFAYLGLTNMTMLFNTENAQLWEGGSFFINIADTHGSMPSADLIGDYQGISNIEAGNHFMLYECWYQQKLGSTVMTVGIQDLNASFMTNDAGSSFINSSFALPPSFSANFPAPVFPHTALGVMVQGPVYPSLHWNAAIYDGTVEECNQSLHSFPWIYMKHNGWLAIGEINTDHSLIPAYSGKYEIGISVRHAKDATCGTFLNYQGYAVANQEIYQANHQHLFSFFQLGYAPLKINEASLFVSTGLTLKGVNLQRPNDEFGCGVAYVRLRNKPFKTETTFESYYSVSLTSFMTIKPDLQYIFHPSKSINAIQNDLVGLIRIQLKL